MDISDISISELLDIKKECVDNFADENGEENILGWAEFVPGLIDEIIRLKRIVEDEYRQYNT